MRVKASTLIFLILFLAGITVIGVSLTKQGTKYAGFEKARKNPGQTVHIIGEICGRKSIKYNPALDPNYMEFCLKDREGTVARVVYYGAPPQDFNFVEEVAMVGYWDSEKDAFVATKILLKCPSKYVEQSAVAVRSAHIK